MIIILNQRAVVTETMRETRRALSMVLKIPERLIYAHGSVDAEGKLHAGFGLDPEITKGLPQEVIAAVMGKIWLDDRKPMLIKRLKHLGDRRG